jgi:hypothetical protein
MGKVASRAVFVLIFIKRPVSLRSLNSARIVLAAEMWQVISLALTFPNVRIYPQEKGQWF